MTFPCLSIPIALKDRRRIWHARQRSTLFPGLQTDLTRHHHVLRVISLLEKTIFLCKFWSENTVDLWSCTSLQSVSSSNPDELSKKQTSGTRNMYNRCFSNMFTTFLLISSPWGQSVSLTAFTSIPLLEIDLQVFQRLQEYVAFCFSSSIFFIMRNCSDEFQTKLLKAEPQIGSWNVTLHLKNQMIRKLKQI